MTSQSNTGLVALLVCAGDVASGRAKIIMQCFAVKPFFLCFTLQFLVEFGLEDSSLFNLICLVLPAIDCIICCFRVSLRRNSYIGGQERFSDIFPLTTLWYRLECPWGSALFQSAHVIKPSYWSKQAKFPFSTELKNNYKNAGLAHDYFGSSLM